MERTLLQWYQRKLIAGNHILHHHGLLDAYGHLSFRHPEDPEIFVMSRSIAPATVSSPDDLVEYTVPEGEAFDPSSPEGYAERRIPRSTSAIPIYKPSPTATRTL
ncbi:hypothetical protein OQA88_10868 [Cercophora sp. LCS_1]